MMRKIFAALILAGVFMAGESFSAEKAIRVNQPVYHMMRFYVYRPKRLPRGFYATFDGYLVYKGAKGVWFYASSEKNGITKTDYVVGSVLPQIVNIKPYDAEISSVAPVVKSNPVTANPAMNPDSKSNRVVYMPPQMQTELYKPLILTPNAADWTQNSNFMAIGKWQKSVNKIGVLYRPKIPIAWKGDFPEVVYAWTGQNWYQLTAKESYLTARKILRREMYDLTVYTNKLNRLQWTEDDSHVLAQYAAMWGYEWVGQIILGRDYD